MAVASVILSSVGLLTCCVILPSLLGSVFGFVAMGTIRRGEATGRSAAVTGLILGLIGLLIGAGFWIAVALSPANEPVPGTRVTASQRATLEKMKVLQPGEGIEMFYPSGNFLIREGGVVITDQRLVVYASSGPEKTCRLQDVVDIRFTPANSWLDEGTFVVKLRSGEILTFAINGMSSGDRLFDEVLRLKTGLHDDADDADEPEQDEPLESQEANR